MLPFLRTSARVARTQRKAHCPMRVDLLARAERKGGARLNITSTHDPSFPSTHYAPSLPFHPFQTASLSVLDSHNFDAHAHARTHTRTHTRTYIHTLTHTYLTTLSLSHAHDLSLSLSLCAVGVYMCVCVCVARQCL